MKWFWYFSTLLQASGKSAESADMDIFADEHMVEMNRKPNPRVGETRKRTRLRSPSPFPSKNNATPSHAPSPAPSLAPPTNAAGGGSGNSDGIQAERPPTDQAKPPSTKEVVNSAGKMDAPVAQMLKQHLQEDTPTSKDPHHAVINANSTSKAEPFKSSSLPEERGHTPSTAAAGGTKSKMSWARKRDRTPSPTSLPNPKRSLSVPGDSTPPSRATSTLQILRGVSCGGGDNHVVKAPPSPASGGGVGGVVKMCASAVLTEEINRQQGQENAKLKLLIVKEVRKQGKSKLCVCVCVCVCVRVCVRVCACVRVLPFSLWSSSLSSSQELVSGTTLRGIQ